MSPSVETIEVEMGKRQTREVMKENQRITMIKCLA